jgi:anti-sigma B factor antagonist
VFTAETVGTEGGAAVVRVVGELDVATAPELNTCLLVVADADIILDLAELTFMDSSGISALVSAHKRSATSGRSFVVRALQPRVAQVLEMTGVNTVLTIEQA